ncbi:MAG TPA: hypothetical protein VJT09_08180 [Pyrinomonadaceae bacterium]|nr:hypothetical protein [Pyrinomonadaceae bacterium]
MKSLSSNLQRRVEALRFRIESLSSLRKLVELPPGHDITKHQWAVIESQLKVVEARLLSRLKAGARAYLPQAHTAKAARTLSALLGSLELEMSRAFNFFDTYMDVLTQRHTPELGPLLAGCDVLAWDAINKEHPALAIVEPPLVYCDRGFGASTLREGVMLPDRTPNPMPLIQIPYSRLKEKYNLTSVLHEVGHEAMVRLGLVTTIPKAFRAALSRAGAPSTIQDLFALWSFEIGPDFWTFCGCGMAEAGAIREILALPPAHIFRISWTDPHPPPYLRALLSFDWCRQVWGSGVWDDWEEEWLRLYPLESAPLETRDIHKLARRYLDVLGRTLLRTRFSVLNGKAIPDLFDLNALAPSELRRRAATSKSGSLDLKGLPPSAQLAVFRVLRDYGKLNEEALDGVMTSWLLKLGEQRRSLQQ